MENNKITRVDPKVSILVPIYGVEKYIEKCTISLMEQTYSNIEYIFVNDCTKDNSIAILKNVIANYPNRISSCRVINHEQNRGLSAARNTALLESTGCYVMHVDSDDYVDPRIVELCVNEALKKDADIVSVARSFVYADFTRVMRIPEINSPEEWRKSLISGRTQHSVWGNLILKKLYTENGILAIEGLHQGEDFAVMPRLAYYSKNHSVVNIPLYYYLVRTDIYQFKEQTIKDTFESWRVVNEFYKTKTDYCLYKEELDKRIQTFLSWQIVSWQSSGKGVTGAELLIKNTFPKADFRIVNDNRKKIVLFLFDKGFYKTLSIFIKFSSQIQRLMGRRGKNV